MKKPTAGCNFPGDSMGRPILSNEHFERAFVGNQFNPELLGNGFLQTFAIRTAPVRIAPVDKASKSASGAFTTGRTLCEEPTRRGACCDPGNSGSFRCQ